MKKVNYTKIRKALLQALQEYDKEVILEIAEQQEGGWVNGCEILNNVDVDTLERIFKVLETNEGLLI